MRGESKMRVTAIDPVSDKRWDDFITEHPEGTIFHHSAWANVLQDRYKCSPAYYVLENERGEILAGAPFFRIQSRLTGRRLACLPSCAYCFPLAYNGEDTSQVLLAAKEEVQSGRVSYLREHPYYLTHVAGLDEDPERLRARLDRDGYHLKRNLKKAEKSELSVREARGEDDLKEFHHLTVDTRRRLSLLPWPYDFFETIYRHIVTPGHGFLLLAELNGKVVGGSMYFRFKDTVILKFNASNRDYAEYRPNYLLTWKAMERACQEGYRRFDFGVSNPENSGLVSFKKQWGSEEAVLPYYYYPAIRGASSSSQKSLLYRAHTTANHWMPEFALKLAAQALYRHLG
jgi:lipid II:glycine glycyltransferase (peptidoglycan interpeptide bridge formation enzyme)